MVVLMTLFVIFFVPETRNVPLEEMEEVRIGQHWFWRRVKAGTQRGDGMATDMSDGKVATTV